MLYFWKAGGSRMSNMTFPCVNPIQLGRSPFNSSPQCKKSSLRYHFSRNSWKLVHKSCCIKVIFDDAAIFFSSPCQVVPGACLSQIVTNSHTSNTHKHLKTPTNSHKTPTNTHKEWCYHTFVKEWMKAIDKTRILAPLDYFYHFSFPSYGRSKSKTNFSNVFLGPCSLIPLMHCS